MHLYDSSIAQILQLYCATVALRKVTVFSAVRRNGAARSVRNSASSAPRRRELKRFHAVAPAFGLASVLVRRSWDAAHRPTMLRQRGAGTSGNRSVDGVEGFLQVDHTGLECIARRIDSDRRADFFFASLSLMGCCVEEGSACDRQRLCMLLAG